MKYPKMIFIFIFLCFLSLSSCVMGPGYDGSGRHMMGYGNWAWSIWFLLVVLAGVFFYFLAKGSRKNISRSGSSEDTALDILKKRYAKGEIDDEQFQRMKKDLEK